MQRKLNIEVGNFIISFSIGFGSGLEVIKYQPMAEPQR